MNRLNKIRNTFGALIASTAMVAAILCFSFNVIAQDLSPPTRTAKVVSALQASQWQELESGLQVIRGVTEDGVVMTAFKISPDDFTFSIITQSDDGGNHVKEIGEQEGAVVAVNAGFFAIADLSKLYPIGYLRLEGEVYSKGWPSSGGTISFKKNDLEFSPTHTGIPDGDFDVIQSKPMLIEPGGKWAMGSNTGFSKPRTMICKLSDGDIVLSTVTRSGLTLYEAGWVKRSKDEGGFFGCDTALAFDGGRSTQVWYSGDEKYSSNGISPVHNFFVVRAKEN